MIRRFALLLALLFAATLNANTLRLGTDVVPTAERVSLNADPRSDAFTGTVSVDLDAKKKVSAFDFHAQDLTITSLEVDGKAAKFESRPQAIVAVTTAKPLAMGRHTMTAAFTGNYNGQAVGFYKMVKDGEPYLYTQFEAIDARRAFPCWDEPSFKLPYQLTLTIPKQYDAVGNTPIASQSEDGDSKTLHFAATKPLPSYLIAFAVGQFDFVPVPGTSIPTRIVAPKGQAALTKLAVETTPPILAALEKYFGQRYPYEKLDLIAVPEFWAGAMENAGAITYKDSILLADPAATTAVQKRNLARVSAHELAHMWFGDLVTLAWWDDLWLNESFADWMGDKITQQVYPELGLEMAEMGPIDSVKNADARATTQAVRQRGTGPEDALNNVGVTYDKGKAVLAMFEHWVTPEKFRAGVLDYLKAHAWRNATESDFFSAMAARTSKSAAEAMETFIDQPGIPLVTVSVAGDEVTLSQTRFLTTLSGRAESWKVPVSIRYSDGTSTKTATVLLDTPSKTITLGHVSWLYPDADAIGYYRWQMPSALMSDVASRAPELLSPKERFAFVGNASALFKSGAIHGDEYLGLLSRFGSDPDVGVISSVSTALGQVEATFDSPEVRPAFAAYVRRTLGPALDRIGFAPKAGEPGPVTILRPTLLDWLYDRGEDPRVREFVDGAAKRYLAEPSSIDPSLANIVVRLYAMSGDAALFDEYAKRFENAKSPAERNRYLNALGSFRDPAVHVKALQYSLTGPLRPNEFMAVTNFGGTAEDREKSYRWMLAHFDEITARLPRPYLSFMPMIASGCEKERVEDARKFFSDEKRRVEGTERTLARVAEQVDQCAALRSREMTAVSKYLQAAN